MADEGAQLHSESEGTGGKWLLMVLGILFVAGSSYGFYDLHTKLAKMAQDQTASSSQIADLTKRMESAEADDEALAKQLGLTKKELAARSAELQRAQKEAVAQLAEEQKKGISQVNGDIANVK